MARRDDVIWAAGFVDGEGCVMITRQAKHRSVYFWMSVVVYQNERPPLDELAELFGGAVFQDQHRGVGWYWRACGPTAGAALSEMLPYMRVKGPQAKTAIAFQGRRLARGKPRPKDFALDQDERDYATVKQLKQRTV